MVVMMALIFLACNKSKHHININLLDKPTTTIETYIAGKWKVISSYGGFCGTCSSDLRSYKEYYEFGPGNTIKFSSMDTVRFSTTYKWFSAPFTQNTSVMELQPGSYLQPSEIKNDTLLLAVPFVYAPDSGTLVLARDK
jgi:hypothetical protein